MGHSSLSEEYGQISDNFWKLIEWQKDQGQLYDSHYQKTYQDGIFDTKTKRLMAMCGAIVMGCRGCILGQTLKAIDEGATADEVMEACSVMLSLGGTMAGSKISIVIEILKEKGLIEGNKK